MEKRDLAKLLYEKNAVVWDVTPCGCRKNQRFGGTYRLHHQGKKNQRVRNVSGNYQPANVFPISLILFTLMMEAMRSSETRLLQEPHGVTPQNTAFSIVTAVKASDFVSYVILP
jgi:hypothetical protein